MRQLDIAVIWTSLSSRHKYVTFLNSYIKDICVQLDMDIAIACQMESGLNKNHRFYHGLMYIMSMSAFPFKPILSIASTILYDFF